MGRGDLVRTLTLTPALTQAATVVGGVSVARETTAASLYASSRDVTSASGFGESRSATTMSAFSGGRRSKHPRLHEDNNKVKVVCLCKCLFEICVHLVGNLR